MKLVIACFLFITLTSCLTVSFNQPQPKDGQRLYEFPKDLQGTWTQPDGDSFTIDATGIGSSNLRTDSLEIVIDTSYSYQSLSDTLRLYKGGKYYIYNEQSNNGSWSFVVSKVDNSGNIYNYLCDDFRFYAKLKGLNADSASYQVQNYYHEIDELYTFDTTLYNPSVKELLTINSDDINWVYFNGQIRINDLRKIAIRKNLITIYRTDGTVDDQLNRSEEEEMEVLEED